MRMLLAILTIAFVKGFAPSRQSTAKRIAREPSSFVIRFNRKSQSTNNGISPSLQMSSTVEPATSTTSIPGFNDVSRRLMVGYKWTAKTNYLSLAFVQAALLASAADIATQTMESAGKVPLDISHVAAMATIAATMSGVFNAICLRNLEGAFPGKSGNNVMLKTMIHAVIIASIINSAYLAGVPLLSDHIYLWQGLPADPFYAWNMDEFWTLTKLEIAMFIPYNTLAFKFVPPQVRPLTHAAISATFNIAVSAVTLGYFDTWCDRAMHMLG